MYSSQFIIRAFLVVLEPDVEATGPERSGPEPELVDTMIEGLDPTTRAERLYRQAGEHAEEQRFYEASLHIVKAYHLLPEDLRHSDTGLFMLIDATEYHWKAYHQSGDEDLLATIQPLLEGLLEHYQGLDPRIETLQRKLEMTRKERISVSGRLLREKKYVEAAIIARSCYQHLRTADKGKFIGQQAVLAASLAYRQAWYVDGNFRHLEAAIDLVDDHLGRAGESASTKVRREKAKLESRAAIARASGGGIDDQEDIGRITQQDRSFLIASGAALAGGVVLSTGAAAVGAYGFDFDSLSNGDIRSIAGQPEHIATSIPLGIVGGVVTGLAIHSMVDTGIIPPRERKILAVGATAVGLLGTLLGSTLLTVGATRPNGLSYERAQRTRGLENAGFSILVGMGAPLGAGIAALVSRRAGAR